MADSTLWWLLTGAAVAVELLTGTFYLLMLAIGLGAAALAVHAGASMAVQLALAALVGGGAVVVGVAAVVAGLVGGLGLVELDQGKGKLTAFQANDVANTTSAAWITAGALGAVGAGAAAGALLLSQ